MEDQDLAHHEVQSLIFPSLPLMVQSPMRREGLGGRYQLQNLIGRGGMAIIYRGWDRRLDRIVAIKVLRDDYTTDPKSVTRFYREARAASALRHPHIVQVFDYGQADDTYYIVMELVEGTDLRDYVGYHGVLDITRALVIAHDIALGLGAAHRRGIVHRDVKPQNILVGRDGLIRLTDFGIASVYEGRDAFRLTTTGMTVGTVHYMPPEQAQGDIVTPAADVYELGVVLYEMLTGRTPFDGDSLVAVALQHIRDAPPPPSQFQSSIPPALEELILRCLEKTPEMRYRDGSELARALEALGDAGLAQTIQDTSEPPLSLEQQSNVPPDAPSIDPSEPSSTCPHTRGSVLSPDCRGSRFVAIVTLLILLATLLLLSFSFYLAVELGFI